MAPGRVRKLLVKDLYVARDATQHIAALIDKVRNGRLLSPEPCCILITGETGTGKSAFLADYVKRSPARRDGSGNLVQPLLHVEFDSFVTVIGAATIMLRKLEDPSNGVGRLVDLTHRIRELAKREKVEAIVIDEFQHLVDTGSKTVNKVGDWLKQLAKSTNLPIVMAGMPASSRVIDGNTQFAGITPYRHEIGMLTYGKDGERRQYRKFLALLDSLLPFDHVGGFADAAIAALLFEATGGSLRMLMQLIREAAGSAIDRNAPSIGMPDLAFGFDQIEAMSPLTDNPFAAMGIMLPDHPGFSVAA